MLYYIYIITITNTIYIYIYIEREIERVIVISIRWLLEAQTFGDYLSGLVRPNKIKVGEQLDSE